MKPIGSQDAHGEPSDMDHIHAHQTQGDTHKQPRAVDGANQGTLVSTLTSQKRRRSSLSNDGGEGAPLAIENNGNKTQNIADFTPPTLPLETLHERRVIASRKKFNKGSGTTLSVIVNQDDTQPPPAKRARTQNKIEISYDRDGTPRINSFSAKFKDGLGSILNNEGTAPFPSSVSSTSSTELSDIFKSSQLLNPARPAQSQRGFCLIHAICRQNDILLHLVSFLTIPSLISLYAISKPFHFLFNRHHTAFILANMRTWAPGAEQVFPWHCYKSLCIKDPAKRQKKRLEGRENEVKKLWADLRDVPSLRWLQMVVWRHGVCKDMLIQLATKGLRCPRFTLDAIKRMWFLMDLPLNAHRIALIRSPEYFPPVVLQRLTHFLLKVDMHFTDPFQAAYPMNHPNQQLHPNIYGGGRPSGVSLRKMLLAERQLTALWRVIRGENWDSTQPALPLTKLDTLRLWIRHRYTPPEGTPEHIRKQSIMGIPWWEVGTAGYERTGVSIQSLSDDKQVVLTHPSIAGTGMSENRQEQILYPHRRRIILANEQPREKLLRPDELLIRECVRRKLKMHKQWALMMFWGFCDSGGRNYPLWTEEEMLRVSKGLKPLPRKVKAEEKTEKDVKETR